MTEMLIYVSSMCTALLEKLSAGDLVAEEADYHVQCLANICLRHQEFLVKMSMNKEQTQA